MRAGTPTDSEVAEFLAAGGPLLEPVPTAFRSAAELASRPDLMEPPAVLVPPIGIEGRVVLLTLGPKAGKSTTAAGLLTEGSRRGVRGGLLTLDEALADSLQRIQRLGADLDHLFLSDHFDPATLEEEVAQLDLRLLVLDHLGKLAERSPDFGPGSQGDPLLWGRLVAPFATLARDLNLAVVLLDQARKSDGGYAGSVAKAGSVDVLCEMAPKDGGLACTPKGRVFVPPFQVTIDDGCPVFTVIGPEGFSRPQRANVVTERHRLDVLAALQSAEPEGLTASKWQSLVAERVHLGRSAFYECRRRLYADGLVSFTSRIYRVTSPGNRRLAADAEVA